MTAASQRHTRAAACILLTTVLASAVPPGGMAAARSALATSCHIHPPAADVPSTDRPTTIGPFADEDRCRSARLRMFGDRGRCHCTTGFTPAWRGREPLPGATDGDSGFQMPLP